MSEEDVREGMRVAVADEPPFAFDPDTWISTAERQVRRRRALVSVGVATTAIVVAAVAVPIGLGLTDNGTGFSTGAPPAASTSPPPTSGQRGYPAEELTQRGAEMVAALNVRLPELMPVATEFQVGQFGGEAVGSVSDGQDYLSSFATFTLGGLRYGIGINTYAPDAYEEGLAEVCAAVPTQCQVLGPRDGGTLVVKTETDQQAQFVTVLHFRDDGSVVSAVGYNYDPTSRTVPTYSPTVPVTVDQLTALAVDKELGL